MEVWKTRPGLEGTLMRTINCNHGLLPGALQCLRQIHLKQRGDFWKTTDEARNSAAYAIQDTFRSKKKKLEKSYKRLHFSKIKTIDYDIFYEIYQYL